MDPHALTTFAANLAKERGVPQVLDVEHSIHVHRPTLTGSKSVASYYIRPPDAMTAEELIALLEQAPGFERMNLTLTAIPGLDTYHQPLISIDDFARKHFNDNHRRVIRVVGKSDQAIEAMAAFIEGLKPPFDAGTFPHHADFSVSAYRPPAGGKWAELKLLFRPADPTLLMKVERQVKIHLAEINLSQEIGASRHSTREQPPELILSSTADTPTAHAYLEALANSLPRATAQDVANAMEAAQRSAGPALAEAPKERLHIALPQATVTKLPPAEVKRRAIAALADILRKSLFGGGLEIQIVQGGSAIEVQFPRTAASLWLGTSFDERKHIAGVASACVGVRADPLLREGWAAQYRFDRKTGKLLVRAADVAEEPANGMKLVPHAG